MSTHTPGPWRVGDAGHTVFGPPNGNPSPETIAGGMTRINAHLIASAPELLALLKEFHKKFITETFDNVDENLEARSMAIIAKAEGAS